MRAYHVTKSKKPPRKKDRFPRNKRKQVAPVARPTRIHPAAREMLANIGKPEPSPFRPDPFQQEASKAILTTDVLVSAPTGSGKTWIALQAAREYLKHGARVWYATPLKALSNAKHQEFGVEFGAENVGILTGDRKENPDAPVIVGTTEILRNQLYDAMHSGERLPVDLVILDEAHYLGDPDRGVVWEEVLIYLPDRVRILLLSATISNAEQVAAWLSHIRRAACRVVLDEVRPVPLYVLFRSTTGELTPFFKGDRLFHTVAGYARAEKQSRKFGERVAPDVNGIVSTLREFQLLPAIVFLKSRADCDKALRELQLSPLAADDGAFQDAIEAETQNYPELLTQRQLGRLIQCRAGSHHAGQLPAWRLFVERMMALGHLEVIFSTSTVAAGVNFPARTVVIVQSDRFDGATFVDMTATDLHQMTGRAGRRGMDKAGFTLIVPGKFMNLELVAELLRSPPEPLESRIMVNFSMALNLLLSHDPAGIKELMGLSFAAFHENPREARKVHQRLQKEFQRHLAVLQELDYVDEKGTPADDGRWAAQLRLDHPLLIAELIRRGTFVDLEPQELAGLMAPFVLDKEREVLMSKALWDETRPLWKKWRRMLRELKPRAQYLYSKGFSVPSVMFWPAAAAYLWGQGVEWTELTRHVRADEGDLAMLLLRTADHVRQLLSLEREKPLLAQTARATLPLLLRLPLV
ncbi:MAG: DEAD/DEAH box helicase [Deltaproteobacteria bacterium]|nr:DEAD/DEAH box helicase [Deltaproteobacteria bacterium]